MEQNTQLSENNNQNNNQVENSVLFKKPEKKNNKKIVLLIAVFVIVLGVIALYFLFFSDKKDKDIPILEDEKTEEIKIDKEFDSDHDGLPDYIEKVLGTDLNNSDTDGDGIPDSVEDATTGLDQTNPADARGDIDGDGMSNLLEYMIGSEIVVPSALFSTLIVVASDARMEITLPGEYVLEGKIYILEHSEVLGVPEGWTPIDAHTPDSVTAGQDHTFTVSEAADSCFYRIRIEWASL